MVAIKVESKRTRCLVSIEDIDGTKKDIYIHKKAAYEYMENDGFSSIDEAASYLAYEIYINAKTRKDIGKVCRALKHKPICAAGLKFNKNGDYVFEYVLGSNCWEEKIILN